MGGFSTFQRKMKYNAALVFDLSGHSDAEGESIPPRGQEWYCMDSRGRHQRMLEDLLVGIHRRSQEQLDFLRARENQVLRRMKHSCKWRDSTDNGILHTGNGIMQSLVQMVTECFLGLPTTIAATPFLKHAAPLFPRH